MEKTYEYQKYEKEAQQLWEHLDIYKFDPTTKKELFTIDTPPPTVSGNLHIGHIFSYTHTDIIARYKRMNGYCVFYPMGFDDNGLATERFVEKQHKTKAHLHKRGDFIALCLKESHAVEATFEALWKKMGLSIDWSKTYSTISEKARRIAQYSFIELYNKKLIERKEEPALYCTTCRTSVAQAELETREFSSTFNTIEFKTSGKENLLIATTRPEFLPGCVAVLFHPHDERYKHLAAQVAFTPLFNKEVPLIADESVDPTKGTGLVMCCTFGDQTDLAWCKKHKLPFVQIVGFDGVWTENAGALAGLRVHEARKKVLELLAQGNFLKEQKPLTHAVHVHERCKNEIEILILRQWFIKVLDHKDEFIKRGEQINWTPSFMKIRYNEWVENLAWDWCISRQRFFGIPFPVWHCVGCSTVILADVEDLPIDPQEKLYRKNCPKCGSSSILPDTDVMDTWATSSLTPQINNNWPEADKLFPMPMSMRPQAHDIIRTWAFYTIVQSHYHFNNIPWRDIVISGHVLAGSEKISKSQDNARMTPETLLGTYPADAIRYWTAKGRLGTDTALSENQFKVGMRLLTKLWNAFQFFKEHMGSYQKRDHHPKLDELNKWLLHRFSKTTQAYKKHFDAYDYAHALDEIEHFFWNDFCDNYLEMIKDQLFNPTKYSDEVIAGTFFTLYEVGFGILQLFAPITPHITETIYHFLFKEREKHLSLHTTELDQKRHSYSFDESAHTIEALIAIIKEVRKLKSDLSLSLKTELASLTIHNANESLSQKIVQLETLLCGITKAVKCNITSALLEKSHIQEDASGLHAHVSLKVSSATGGRELP